MLSPSVIISGIGVLAVSSYLLLHEYLSYKVELQKESSKEIDDSAIPYVGEYCYYLTHDINGNIVSGTIVGYNYDSDTCIILAKNNGYSCLFSGVKPSELYMSKESILSDELNQKYFYGIMDKTYDVNKTK
jgi:hypothetical protein